MANKHNSVILEFDPAYNAIGENKQLRDGLSVVIQLGDTLWVANDETIALERLTRSKSKGKDKDMAFGEHRRFSLHEYLRLPVPPKRGSTAVEEIDIEGLDFANGYFWLVGSHSRKRKIPKLQDGTKPAQKQLAKVSRDGNRYLLARIPVADDELPCALSKTAGPHGERRAAAQLGGSSKSNDLMVALRKDKHLAPFLAIPGKDNGFDIEGLAIAGERLFLGLRGPVLRGWAVILEIELKEDRDDASVLQLQAIGPKKNLYRKHFLQLDGLGIRDLCMQGDDLLILAGPTMDLDGPVRVYRWQKGRQTAKESLIPARALEKLLEIPYGEKVDHAEGLALFTANAGSEPALLVVYDTAAANRKVGENKVLADVFPLK